MIKIIDKLWPIVTNIFQNINFWDELSLYEYDNEYDNFTRLNLKEIFIKSKNFE